MAFSFFEVSVPNYPTAWLQFFQGGSFTPLLVVAPAW
jgi:hypothetical protein